MPRLPDVSAVRPSPRSNMGVASAPLAGVIGEAVSGLGRQLQGAGGQLLERQDNLAFNAARTALLKADVAARAELENDQDWPTFETRYSDRMREAREQARGLIRSSSGRAVFEAQAELDFTRGQAEVARSANAKRVASERATLDTSLDALHDTARNAQDQATRAAAIETATGLLQAAQDGGLYSPEEIGNFRRSWVSDYLTEQVSGALRKDDPVAAADILERNRDNLSWQARESLEGDVKRSMDKRVAYDDARAALGRDWSQEGGSGTNYADPLRGRGSGVSDPYGVERTGGKTHNGTDFTAPEGTPIYSIGAGKVVKAGFDGKSGHFIVIDHGNGRTSSYSHMQAASGLEVGAAVTPDMTVGKVGSTGNSSGPHLHLVVRDGDKTVDPQKVIGNARQKPSEHDLEAALGQVDVLAETQGWSFERRERAKDEVRRQVSVDEHLKAREEAKADEEAADIVVGITDRGGRLTDTSQIPRSTWERMSPGSRARYSEQAIANRQPPKVQANGDVATVLEMIRILDPDRFLATNLAEYAGQITPGELSALRVSQARVKKELEGGRGTSIRSSVSATISTYDTPDMWSDDKNEAARQRVSVQRIMESDLEAVTGGKRAATDAELHEAFLKATGISMRRTKSVIGVPVRVTDVRRYEIEARDVPADIYERIRTGLRQTTGSEPSEDRIVEEYQRGRGRYW